MSVVMSDFDAKKAKEYLQKREREQQEEKERERKVVLERVLLTLKKEFAGTQVEVYLVGSILRPFAFSSQSDVDIVLKNFQGDRFDLWPKLEEKIERKVEIILFETCHFQQFVLKEGLKVV